MDENLAELERRSISIIREAKAQFSNLAVLWSTGKDSTATLWLCKKAFFGKIPFPVIHIDTGYQFPEIYEFRDRIAEEWGLDLIIAKNRDALEAGISPEGGRLECCTRLKTEALKRIIDEYGFDALILAIRRDEHGIRAKERIFSPRDREFRWRYTDQPAEMWDLYVKPSKDFSHMRVHPILHWTELDVWEYVRQENLPVNQLYFSSGGKRYRSLGCMPCTVPVPSEAKTINEIIEELKETKIPERAGRAQDKERAYMMQKLRSLGYM
ncbi:MAG: sulfate adenylyltransferase [Candidatus Bathyarchaeota archaeon B63]|nr:MAG: sulfate adenylyltransferase [Candidatus Bathyarchaeota archaeon B63]